MKHSCLVILFVISAFSQVNADIERRAAVDIGSGGTKVAIADIDTETDQIIQIVLDTSFPIQYQASLDKSVDGTFDRETKDLGIKVFKEIKEIADQYQVQKIVAIATSAFRKANDSKAFVTEIEKQTKIHVQIIPQREEGDSLNKTDKELNNPFAHVDVSNCILTLAIMKALHIQEIRPVETTTTRGLLVSPSYWMREN